MDVLLQGHTSQYLAATVDDFKTLLNRVAGTFKSKKALAEALDIDASRLSRAINAGDFPFNIENCLRLARLSGEPASEVLRAAEKGEIAELIEQLYGPEKTVTDPVMQDLLKHWPTFSADEKAFVGRIMETVLRARRVDIDEQPGGHRAKRPIGKRAR